MSEMEDRINNILSDPQQMEKIMNMASAFMGGETPTQPDSPDMGMLSQLTQLMRSGSGGDKTALLQGLAPFLRPDRQKKLQKALRLAQAMRIAGIALESYGGDKDV